MIHCHNLYDNEEIKEWCLNGNGHISVDQIVDSKSFNNAQQNSVDTLDDPHTGKFLD